MGRDDWASHKLLEAYITAANVCAGVCTQTSKHTYCA